MNSDLKLVESVCDETLQRAGLNTRSGPWFKSNVLAKLHISILYFLPQGKTIHVFVKSTEAVFPQDRSLPFGNINGSDIKENAASKTKHTNI